MKRFFFLNVLMFIAIFANAQQLGLMLIDKQTHKSYFIDRNRTVMIELKNSKIISGDFFFKNDSTIIMNDSSIISLRNVVNIRSKYVNLKAVNLSNALVLGGCTGVISLGVGVALSLSTLNAIFSNDPDEIRRANNHAKVGDVLAPIGAAIIVFAGIPGIAMKFVRAIKPKRTFDLKKDYSLLVVRNTK
jgi:hypothetical protein